MKARGLVVLLAVLALVAVGCGGASDETGGGSTASGAATSGGGADVNLSLVA